jgi:hypothetical protein
VIARLILLLLGLFGVKAALTELLFPSEPVPAPAVLILITLFSLLAIAAALIPFFGGKNWPAEKDVEGKTPSEIFRALYPILSAHLRGRKTAADALIQASRAPEEIILLRLNCEDSFKRPALAVLTNRRYILYRMQSQWVLRALKQIEWSIAKVPVFGDLLSMLVAPFAESYELITCPRDKLYEETMGFADEAVLAGRVRWTKRVDLHWEEVALEFGSVSGKKSVWSGKFEVDLFPRKLRRFFRAPPGFAVEHLAVRVAATHFLAIFEKRLTDLGCQVKRKETSFEIELPSQG